MVYSQETAAGFVSIDVGHWARVYAERARLGLPVCKAKRGPIADHPLRGKTLVNREGKSYVVESVTRDWHAGWFLTVMLRTTDTNSHGTRVLSNESSIAPFIQRQADEFFTEFATQH